jgi:hypothetical protein
MGASGRPFFFYSNRSSVAAGRPARPDGELAKKFPATVIFHVTNSGFGMDGMGTLIDPPLSADSRRESGRPSGPGKNSSTPYRLTARNAGGIL